VVLARLAPQLAAERHAGTPLSLNWSEVEKWSEQSRYDTSSMQDAQKLLDAIGQIPNGVLEWIRQLW
jgi:hypothetical protein